MGSGTQAGHLGSSRCAAKSSRAMRSINKAIWFKPRCGPVVIRAPVTALVIGDRWRFQQEQQSVFMGEK